MALVLGSLLMLTACTTAGELNDDAADESVPAETTIASDDTSSGESDDTRDTGDRVVEPLAAPEVVWAGLSQDDRNGQCSSHLDNSDQIWETLSSEGASEDEVAAYQAMLDVECSEGR